MARGLRTRIFVLQIGLIGVFAFCAGFLFWGNSFIHGQVQDQLVAQKISFPAAGSPGFSAAQYPALQQYAGQQVDNGPKAQAYADHYIGYHLSKVAGGKTYSEVSAAYLAGGSKDTTLAAQRQTLFMGETLRGLLLNAYGWWQVGQYAFYAAIGLTVAAVAVFTALVFEVFMALRRQAQSKTAPTARPVLAGGGS
jgi:hypothetical protein